MAQFTYISEAVLGGLDESLEKWDAKAIKLERPVPKLLSGDDSFHQIDLDTIVYATYFDTPVQGWSLIPSADPDSLFIEPLSLCEALHLVSREDADPEIYAHVFQHWFTAAINSSQSIKEAVGDFSVSEDQLRLKSNEMTDFTRELRELIDVLGHDPDEFLEKLIEGQFQYDPEKLRDWTPPDHSIIR